MVIDKIYCVGIESIVDDKITQKEGWYKKFAIKSQMIIL